MKEGTHYASFTSSACAKAWRKVGARRRAGVATPLFSIYSKSSIGIGEIPNLKRLVDWCVKTGISLIQLLPLNDVAFDFRPYDAQSSTALDPMYLSLDHLVSCDLKLFSKEVAVLRRKFPAGKGRVNYEVKAAKLDLLKKIFSHQSTDLKDKKFSAFRKKQSGWLSDYAVFKALKVKFNAAGWMDWPEEFRNRNSDVMDQVEKECADEILFNQWLQWQLYQQLSEVKHYATGLGVLLMGDMPFLVSRDSSDVWANQDYFKLDLSSGAPPDLYFAKGQRWGMPPYHWERIAADGYKYLTRKMQYLENFFDLYRVDHFVGMFRLWTIPVSEPAERAGVAGTFDPPVESDWKEHGRRILDVMTRETTMLPCAEDLGTVPKCSYEILDEYKIPGSDVQRWVRNWNTDMTFKSADHYRPNGMAMLSTHDTSAFCAWWEYEAGTVDEEFFAKKCAEAGMNFDQVRARLFDLDASAHGRSRWKTEISDLEKFLSVIGRKKEEAWHLAEAFLGTYNERDLYWKYLGLDGVPAKKASGLLVRKALEAVNGTCSVFSLQLLQDWLALGNYPGRNDWEYRINVPGSMASSNWSLVSPFSLEKMMTLPMNRDIRAIVARTNREVSK